MEDVLGPSKYQAKFPVLIITLVIANSCAWLSSRPSMFGSDDSQQKQSDVSKVETETVTKDQYNALVDKYEQLQQQLQEKNVQKNPDKMNMLDELKKAKSDTDSLELAQTVDVFAEQKANAQGNLNVEVAPVVDQFVTDIDADHARLLEAEIFELQKAESLMNSGNYADALIILRKLQKSKYKQIQVRAQFTVGEVLFSQNEFDLAMQAFEEVINRHAFSGVVLKTLGRLIVCTDKLKLKEKQDQYYSILHDFFEGA